jgi:hypothetical protein
VKKLVLLSVAALMLASSVFAPVAQAQEPGDVDILSWTLPPNDLWTVSGTIQCTEGAPYSLDVFGILNVNPHRGKFKKHQPISFTEVREYGDCAITGPQSFTVFLLPRTVTEKDKVWLEAAGEVNSTWGEPDIVRAK